MTRRLYVFGGLILLALAGCSNLIAKGPMSRTIDANAATARVNLQRAQANAIGVDEARIILTNNAVEFARYDSAATSNLFAYMFGQPTILASPPYRTLLARVAVLSDATAIRAATQPADVCSGWVAVESRVLIQVQDARDGREGAKP